MAKAPTWDQYLLPALKALADAENLPTRVALIDGSRLRG